MKSLVFPGITFSAFSISAIEAKGSRVPSTNREVGGAHPPPRAPTGVFALAADRGPLPAGPGLQVQRPELVHAENHLRVPVLREDLAVGDRVQVLDPRLFPCVLGVFRCLPRFQPLKGDAFLAEQDPEPFVADVVDHPLSHQEVGQLGQAPGGKRQAVVTGMAPGDLLDLAALREGEGTFGGRPPFYLGYSELNPVGVEVADHVPDPVLAGKCHLRDPRCVHALG